MGDFDSVVVCRSGFGVGRGVELVDGSAGSTAEEAADFPWLGGVANESSFDRHVAVKFGLSLREVTCHGKNYCSLSVCKRTVIKTATRDMLLTTTRDLLLTTTRTIAGGVVWFRVVKR